MITGVGNANYEAISHLPAQDADLTKIRTGRLSEAVFAANLWTVVQGSASTVYISILMDCPTDRIDLV